QEGRLGATLAGLRTGDLPVRLGDLALRTTRHLVVHAVSPGPVGHPDQALLVVRRSVSADADETYREHYRGRRVAGVAGPQPALAGAGRVRHHAGSSWRHLAPLFAELV